MMGKIKFVTFFEKKKKNIVIFSTFVTESLLKVMKVRITNLFRNINAANEPVLNTFKG